MASFTCTSTLAYSSVSKNRYNANSRLSSKVCLPAQKNGLVKCTSNIFHKKKLNTRNLQVRAEAEAETAAETVETIAPATEVYEPESQGESVEDNEFSIAKVSFGTIALTVGVSMLVYGFGAFFQFLPGADISSILLIYGFPISLIGAALQYAKLDPVPCTSYKAAVALRETQATAIQTQVREDVTRYRYGDEQHLDLALERVFRLGQAGGVARKNVPLLTAIREEVNKKRYTLVLCFDDNCPFEEFESRQLKIKGFFGPGVEAPLTKVEGGVEVALISNGENVASDDDDEWIILPPLQPGLPPRRARKGTV